jgi:hypothetical protein
MTARVRLEDVTSQRDALEKIARLIRSGSIDPRIQQAAKALTRSCDARDDLCELQAIYDAVKEGSSAVSWLRDGMRYVADSYSFDVFNTVNSIIRQCSTGACAGDCDDQTILVGSLAAALGFKTGARAWGKGTAGDYQHVYPVACVPKAGPWPRNYFGTALDTTVPRFNVGDEPEGGHIMTAWIE